MVLLLLILYLIYSSIAPLSLVSQSFLNLPGNAPYPVPQYSTHKG
jgi:hypothetical protein